MTDQRLEGMIANLLRAGVGLAAAIVIAGGAWYLAVNGAESPAYARFHPPAAGLAALAAVPGPQALIGIGLLVLIATPVARVFFSLVAFALERDRLYVAITVAVLAILAYGIAAG